MATPTTDEIYALLIDSFTTQYGESISAVRKSFLRVLSAVLAGLYIVLYKYADFLGLQMFTSTASTIETTIGTKKIVPLIERGRENGTGNPKAATAARFNISIAVTSQIGALQVGAQLASEKNQIIYSTDEDVELNADVVTVGVTAVSDIEGGLGLGVEGNLDVGDTLYFISPYAYVSREAIIAEIIEVAVDGEDLNTSYRERVLDRDRNPPQGGAPCDYKGWGESVAGIANIYPYVGNPSEVNIYVEAEGTTDGIPTDEQLTAVENALIYDDSGLATRKPITAGLLVYPISRSAFDVVIYNLEVSNESVVLDDIKTDLDYYFLQREPYISGLSLMPRNDRITRTGVESIIAEIVNEYQGVYDGIELYRNSINIGSYCLGIGEKAKLGELTLIS